MKKILKNILLFFVIWTVVHLAILLKVGLIDNKSKADAILIFGNKVEIDGKPSLRLKSRLDEGIKLFNSNMASFIIVSGGFGKEGFDEALIMKDYLIKAGISQNAILTDQEGNNTYLTAKNTLKISKGKNIKSIIVVSQYYHLLRVKSVMERFGFTVYTSHAKMFPEIRDFYSIPREIVAYYFYIFKNYK